MIKKAKLLILLFAYTATGLGQKNITDSLKLLFNKSKHDTVRCSLLTGIIESEYDEKIWPQYNDSLFEISKRNLKISNSKRLRDAYSLFYAHAVSNKAFLMLEYGNISKALEFYFEVFDMYEKLGAKNNLAVTLNNIAYIYKSQGEIDKAMEQVNKALKYQEETENTKGIAETLNNIGLLYQMKHDPGKALEYFNKAIELNKKTNDPYGLAISLTSISGLNEYLGNYEEAIKYQEQTLAIREKLGGKEGIAHALSSLAKLKYQIGNLKEALDHGNKSYKISKELNYIDNLKSSASVLYKIHSKMKNYEEALKMYEVYVVLRDSLTNESVRKATYKKELQYSYNKKTTADSVRVAEERKVVNAQLKEEETRRFALTGGLVLLALFGVFMFNRFKVSQKQNRVIEQQKGLIEEAQKETLDSIHYAKRIQNALITNSKFIDTYLPSNFIYFNPKDIVSGDFYWACSHGSKFYLAVCDSTGHGVPGAFMSLLNMGFLNEAIKEKGIEKPSEIFNYVRSRLIETMNSEEQKDGMDGILLCYDRTRVEYEYSAANNEPLLIRDGKIIELKKDKMPVGKGEKLQDFTTFTLELQKGDELYLHTDGFADQFGGERGKKFMNKRLNELFLSVWNIPLSEKKEKVESVFNIWKGNLEQVDDVLVVGIKI